MAKYIQKSMAESGVCFADPTRGIIADQNGSLFFCERGDSGELSPACAPFYIPPPFHIISSEELDPYFIVVLECGRIYVYNFLDRVQVLDISVPPYKGMIDKIHVKENGTILLLESEKRKLKWQSGYWTVLSEISDELTVDIDNKSFAKCTVYENSMCAAIDSNNKTEYFEVLSKYMLFITANLPREAVMNLWFEIVSTQTNFGDCRAEFHHIIDMVRSMDTFSSYAEEMQMAISQ